MILLVFCAAPAGCALPDLELDGTPVTETDEEGSAFYGDVRIVEGSGTVTRETQHLGGQPGAMELQLCAEVAGLGDAGARYTKHLLGHASTMK